MLADLGTSAIDERASLTTLLKRPQVSINDFRKLPSSRTAHLFLEYSTEVLEQAEILIKYDSYIQREQILAEKLGSLEDYQILPDFDYDRVKALSLESREKLKRIRPETIGQASRISGVSPADVSVLTIYMGK
jgi:tRNA uridine 5-carboxymethylaminomethyl modification enzyme